MLSSHGLEHVWFYSSLRWIFRSAKYIQADLGLHMYLIPHQEQCQATPSIACAASRIFCWKISSPRTSVTHLMAGLDREDWSHLLPLSSSAQGQFLLPSVGKSIQNSRYYSLGAEIVGPWWHQMWFSSALFWKKEQVFSLYHRFWGEMYVKQL